ncbi:MAG: hypothetical protein AAF614_22655 [Chloroflexota bacterium]
MDQTSPNRKRNVLILAAMILLFAVYLLAFLLPDFIRTVAGPREVTMAQAAELASDDDAYVTILDGSWDCETIKLVRGPSATNTRRETTRATEVFLTNEAGTVVLLATMSGESDCAELQTAVLSGYLNKMTPEQEQDLINEVRLARFINATTFLEMCGFCGPTNSLIGTLFGFAFALLGIGLLVYGLGLFPRRNDPLDEPK